MIYQHFVTPITPAKSMRAFMSRRVAMPAMWYETEVFDEDPETPGELLFRVKERHLTAGKKPHPRDGLIIHTGFFKTDTKKTYVFDRKSKKHLPADKHPAVVQALNKKNERIKKQVKSIRNLQVLLNARGFDQKKK
ncbi:MAG: hypothetical protein CMO80_00895 [Verrucomicrobiales bacterium]|nr:hypothetical protein [Verrucomicrobiales bacterium]|tara:strand:- start:626 stop:1033 length:408 start_codon:yes stop_codon:yes gene_type:complete